MDIRWPERPRCGFGRNGWEIWQPAEVRSEGVRLMHVWILVIPVIWGVTRFHKRSK